MKSEEMEEMEKKEEKKTGMIGKAKKRNNQKKTATDNTLWVTEKVGPSVCVCVCVCVRKYRNEVRKCERVKEREKIWMTEEVNIKDLKKSSTGVTAEVK